MKTNLNLKIQGHVNIKNQVGIILYNNHNDIDQAIAVAVVATRLSGGINADTNGITQLEFNYGSNLTGLVDITSYTVEDGVLTLTIILTDENFIGTLNHLYLKTPIEETFSSRENINITKEEGETLYITWKLTFII